MIIKSDFLSCLAIFLVDVIFVVRLRILQDSINVPIIINYIALFVSLKWLPDFFKKFMKLPNTQISEITKALIEEMNVFPDIIS
jgi:hypothetical protein